MYFPGYKRTEKKRPEALKILLEHNKMKLDVPKNSKEPNNSNITSKHLKVCRYVIKILIQFNMYYRTSNMCLEDPKVLVEYNMLKLKHVPDH